MQGKPLLPSTLVTSYFYCFFGGFGNVKRHIFQQRNIWLQVKTDKKARNTNPGIKHEVEEMRVVSLSSLFHGQWALGSIMISVDLIWSSWFYFTCSVSTCESHYLIDPIRETEKGKNAFCWREQGNWRRRKKRRFLETTVHIFFIITASTFLWLTENWQSPIRISCVIIVGILFHIPSDIFL